MTRVYNIYADESGHLPNDQMPIMVQGAIVCPLEKSREANVRLREIREKHHLPTAFEVKWTSVSPAKVSYYRELVDYFFDDDDLTFRAVVAQKGQLDHGRFSQTHDEWYYKMMYQLHTRLLVPGNAYRIYLDKKDTRSADKTAKLQRILANSMLDFDRKIVGRVQVVQSHEIALLQLADLLLGAVGYATRGLQTSSAKLEIVNRIRQRSGATLTRSTLPSAQKFNIFHWTGQR